MLSISFRSHRARPRAVACAQQPQILATMTGRDDDAPHALVRRSFGPNAAAYSTSATQANATVLARLVAKVAPRARDRVLDVATGAGHSALALAPLVDRVIAADVTTEMLSEVRRNAAARGASNVVTVQAAAEALPFRASSFDVVVCRLATHHFAAVATALAEMARVLADAGRVVIFDTMVPEDDELDREINAIERLRDPSHVRNHRPSEWRALLARAGLEVAELETEAYDGSEKSLADWTARVRTPPEIVAGLRRMLASARPALRDVLRVQVDGDDVRFDLPRIVIVAHAMKRPPLTSSETPLT